MHKNNGKLILLGKALRIKGHKQTKQKNVVLALWWPLRQQGIDYKLEAKFCKPHPSSWKKLWQFAKEEWRSLKFMYIKINQYFQSRYI